MGFGELRDVLGGQKLGNLGYFGLTDSRLILGRG
jgi:hypothetical protein